MGLKVICLPVYNRPGYLKKVLDCLEKNRTDNYLLVISLEPGSVECREICEEVDFMEKQIFRNKKKLGVKHNTFESVNRGVNIGADFLVYLEDDVVLSPDALELADWFYEAKFEHDIMCMNFINLLVNGQPDKVILSRYFSPLSFAVHKETWDQYFKPNWLKGSHAWDVNMVSTLLEKPDLFVIRPEMSRCNHIGWKHGVSKIPYSENKRIFSKIQMNWQKEKFEYALEIA